MALTATQQALYLFKKLMGKGSTSLGFDFYNEPKNGRPAVQKSQVWAQSDLIPTTAPGSTSGVVQLFTNDPLTAVPGTTNAFSSANLIDAIPFNFGDGTSYNYTLKDSTTATIPFGTGDWIVDPDTGTVTFYGTVPPNMPPTITFYKYVGTKGFGSGGGGGGGSLQWVQDVNSPTTAVEFGQQVFLFNVAPYQAQTLWALIRVPSTYTAGGPVKLYLPWYSPDASGTAALVATSYLVRPGTDAITSTTNSNASTNTNLSIGANVPQVSVIDVTDGTGKINGVSVAAGNLIKVAVSLNGGNTSDVRALGYGAEVTFV